MLNSLKDLLGGIGKTFLENVSNSDRDKFDESFGAALDKGLIDQ